MEISEFLDQFLKLKEKELEQKVWEIWLSKYPHMSHENYISYDEMLNTAKQQETKQDIQVNGVYVDQVFF